MSARSIFSRGGPARLSLLSLAFAVVAGCGGGGSGGDAAAPAAAPVASGGGTAATAPSGGGTAVAPSGGGSAATPAGGGTAAAPSGGGTAAPPAGTGGTTPPATPTPTAVTYATRVLDPDGVAGPFALNAAGEVAFTAVRPDGTHALFFDGTTVQVLGGAGSRAVAVNASGQVAGDAKVGGTGPRAFFWTSPGPPLDLGTGPGNASTAVGINASGRVTGTFTAGNGRPKAYFWAPPSGPLIQEENLGGVTNVTATSEPVQINDAGSIAGNATNPSGATHAVQWGPAVRIRDLPGTGARGDSFTRAMNAAGDIAGEAENLATGSRFAFLAPAAGGLLQDLGTLGGKDSSAVAINDAGQVAGESQDARGLSHAFLWVPANGGAMRDLGTLGGLTSSAAALDANGRVCGSSLTAAGATHAFVWSAAEGMVDLNDRLAAAPAGLVVTRCVALSGRSVLAQSSGGLVLLQAP